MAVISPADPRDVQDFQFKLVGRLRIFTAADGTFTNAVNLVATASKFGLIFVGCPTGLQVITTSSVSTLDFPSSASGAEISNYLRREVSLPSQPTHLNVSCDQNLLVVALMKDGCAHALIYNIPSFVAANVVLVSEVRLSTKPDTSILELSWNPGIPNILAACLSDGSMAAYEVKPSGLDISTLPPATQATCFCWSPKGKQLVIGSETGTLTQYKPDLKAVKSFAAPSLGSGSVAVVNVLWISNYQFAAVYRDKVNSDERPGLLIVNAPKTGSPSFVNYEDICYSGGDLRPPQFYLIHQSSWNILMMASANSMEVGVMGLQEDQISWEQWTQEDAARAELPLSASKQETFPIGLGLDTSTQNVLPWGENQSLPPMPVLYILSHQGVLCLFYAVNLRPNAATICSSPEMLPDQSGLSLFTTTPSVTIQSPAVMKTPEQAPALQQSGTAAGNLRVNLSQKFEGITAQDNTPGSISFGGPTTSSIFGSASLAPGTGFNLGLSSSGSTPASNTLTSASAPTVTSSSIFSNPSTNFPGFGSSATFGGGLPSLTSGFGSSLNNAPSANFATNLNTTSTLRFSLPSTTMNSSSMMSSNRQSFSFAELEPSTELELESESAPTAKPSFSFLTTTTSTTSTSNMKPNFSFTAPALTSSTAQQPQKLTMQTMNPPPQVPSTNRQGIFQSGLDQTGSVTKVQTAKVEPLLKQPISPVGPPPPIAVPVSNSVFFNAINEEVTLFEKELLALCSRVNGINVQVGSQDEKTILRQKVDFIDEFLRELKETTQAQSLEIHSLKSVFMEAFAWTEEAKSVEQQLNSPMYVQVARSQALDPVSARYAANIKHLVYYVENQLRQVNEQLDGIWLEFQDSCKPSTRNKLYIPTLESVYQAMVMQNNILNKQRAIMADIARRAQEQGQRTQIPLISSAVLARVRDKEALQSGKEETELSRLAENLVQMKLRPPEHQNINGIGVRNRRLTRKKESYLRELLSQRTVTRVCPTKPVRPTLGGISVGKPIISKIETEKISGKEMPSTPASDTIIIETKRPQTNFEVPKTSLFLFGSSKSVGDLDIANKNFFIKNTTSTPTSKDIKSMPVKTILPAAFSPTVDSNISENNIKIKPSTEIGALNTSGFKTDFSFASPLQSAKPMPSVNFSFGAGLSKVPSVGTFDSTSKKLEDLYEDVTPPTTPERYNKESASNISVPSSSFNFSLSYAETASKTNVSNSNSSQDVSTTLPRSLAPVDNIFANIGEDSNANKLVPKSTPNKLASSPSSTAFSFSSVSLGQTQPVSKPEESKTSSETFKFSFGNVSSPLIPAVSNTSSSPSNVSPSITPPKLPISTQSNITLKTPLFSSFGFDNQNKSSSNVSIFGGGESQKISPSTIGSNISSPSTNIFAQAATSMFGNITTGSSAKQQAISSVPESTPTTSSSISIFSKQSPESTTVVNRSNNESQEISHSPEKSNKTSFSVGESLFQSPFSSLSLGTGTSKPAGSIFGGSSTPASLSFTFGKTTEPSDNQANITEIPDSSQAEDQKPVSEEPSSDVPVSTTGEEVEEKPDSTSNAEEPPALNQPVTLSSPDAEASVPPPTTTAAFSLSTLSVSSSTNTSEAPIFGQISISQKSPSSIFGGISTPTTIPQTSSISSSAVTATEGTSSSNITFSFTLPPSTSSTQFNQSSTKPFDQSVTTSNLFGQPLGTSSAFGQSGNSIFGQSATAPTTKPSMFGEVSSALGTQSGFGQTSNTSASQPLFGQTSSQSIFGQATTGSSFLGGSSSNGGGFGSKSTFGQSGGSIFGQSTSPAFGTSGGSIFGGSGASIFGGNSNERTGNLFQSTGGSIFGGNSGGGGASTGGSFSTGIGQSISQSGFGSPTAFQGKPGGFGGSPVFGSSPDSPTSSFGAAPTFGSSPTFRGSLFGSTSPTGFASPVQQQSSTFESLATQNTMTFGNLAQNQGQGFGSPTVFGSTSQPTQASSPPAFSRGSAFGGNSFSSWR